MIKRHRSNFRQPYVVLLLVALLIACCLRFYHVHRHSGIGRMYVVSKNEYVPLFCRSGTRFEYEIGSSGANCYDLNTMLPPGTFVRIVGLEEKGTVPVMCTVSENYSVGGFIHPKLFEWAMEAVSDADRRKFKGKAPVRDVPSLREIDEMMRSFLENDVPCAWGCNNLNEVRLDALYTFVHRTRIDWRTRYRCIGLDGTGLLHMVSGWMLPHNTELLYGTLIGKCLHEFDRDVTDEELRGALSSMMDTDFVVLPRGYVVVFWRGGFLEAMGKNTGIKYTDAADAIAVLRAMVNRGRMRIIRWHPDLLAAEKGNGKISTGSGLSNDGALRRNGGAEK